MVMLSQLLKCQVYDQEQTVIGTLVDVLVPLPKGGTLPGQAVAAVRVTPLVQALIVQRPGGTRLQVSPTQIERVETHALRLNCALGVLPLAQPSPAGLSLAEAVLDHQIVDLAHLRVQRVNEVCFDACWRLVGVACSPVSGLSRLLPARLAAPLAPRVARSVLPWHQVALFPSADPDQDGLLPLLPTAGPGALACWSGASMAALVQTLRPYAGSQVLSAIPPSVAASALGRLPPLQRSRVFKHLPGPHAAAIVKRLPPALALALLDAVPEGRAQALLESLDPIDAALLQGVVAAPADWADGAGSLMTSACLRISQESTAAEAIAVFRTWPGTPGQRAYLYCVTGAASEERLVGVVSLWDVLAAHPACRLREVMQTTLICVTPRTNLQTVAARLCEHDLLALPVVDETKHFLGVVTLDALLPHLVPARRTRQWLSTRPHARTAPW